MKKFIFTLTLVLFGISLSANGPFYEALQKMEYHTVPRTSGPEWKKYKWGPEFWVSEKEYALRLYKDIRLKETYICRNSPWPDIKILCRIPVPNSPNTLLYCGADDSDWSGGSLIIVDKQGYVLDALIAMYNCRQTLMQWEITSDWKITITSLAATEADTFEMGLFNWFIGNRTDNTYIIRNGKFVLTKTQKYKSKKYTKELLTPADYDLMKGGETPIR